MGNWEGRDIGKKLGFDNVSMNEYIRYFFEIRFGERSKDWVRTLEIASWIGYKGKVVGVEEGESGLYIINFVFYMISFGIKF